MTTYSILHTYIEYPRLKFIGRLGGNSARWLEHKPSELIALVELRGLDRFYFNSFSSCL